MASSSEVSPELNDEEPMSSEDEKPEIYEEDSDDDVPPESEHEMAELTPVDCDMESVAEPEDCSDDDSSSSSSSDDDILFASGYPTSPPGEVQPNN